MAKTKVLGTQYGIEITRPWSNEMYEHNEKVAGIMKLQIEAAIAKALEQDNEEDMKKIGTAINAYRYGYSMDMESIHEDCLNGMKRLQNHWIHSDTWPDLLQAGLVTEIEQGMVGYDKL